MSKTPLYPHIRQKKYSDEANDAVYEAHNTEMGLISRFQQGLISASTCAIDSENAWRKAMAKIIQARRS